MHWRLLLARRVWLVLLVLAALSGCRRGSATVTPAAPVATASPTATAVRPTMITATATPSRTVSPVPPATLTPSLAQSPTDTPSSTWMPSPSTANPSPTLTALATLAGTPSLTAAVTNTPTTSPSPTATGLLRRVVLSGELAALQVAGEVRWDAVRLECLDATRRVLERLALGATSAEVRLPQGTAWVRLWIGEALGGAAWWQRWDSATVAATDGTIALAISPVSRPPTDTPVPTPTSPPPTAAPG